MIMYIFNDSKKFKLVCVKYDNCIEFKVNRNGNVIEGILSKGVYYNWIAFPSLNTSCQLADFSDSFWNEEQLFNVFHNDFDVSTVLMTISELNGSFAVRTISPTLMVISSCPLANISSGLKINVKSYPIR